MKQIFLWIWLGLLLGGCSQPSLRPVCPTLVRYTQTDQKTLITELTDAPDKPELVRWLGDYIGLRDQVRACQKSAKS